MKPERWHEVERIYHAAVERSPEERAAFIAEACAKDDELRREVESLLEHENAADDFIESPALEVAARMMAEDAPAASVNVGQAVNQYRIIEPLGKGGMGEVFLAEDTRLGRKVALKFLPAHLTKDQEHLRRFEQEARAVAALSHPNVCMVHEVVETPEVGHCIVMEYVAGETLRERITDGKLTVEEALDAAIQLASALAAAHAAGIVHRDIKPENIIFRPDGYVKILDFGLAKLTETAPAQIDDNDKTWILEQKTLPGLVIGTVAYMSPEQARGIAIDARTDIWSLGVVLYEMVTGQKPFTGATPMDVIISIAEREPAPISNFNTEVPSRLEEIVQKALAKDREARYQTADDLLSDLKDMRHDLAFDIERKINVSRFFTGNMLRSRTLGMRIGIGAGLLTLVVAAFWFAGGFGRSSLFASQTGADEHSKAAKTRLESSPAYDLYVRGKVKVASENREETLAAIKLLEEAAAIDPTLAEVHAQLARGFNTMAFKYSSGEERKRYHENAEVAIEKALILDPNLAEAHFARGLILWSNSKGFPHEKAIQSYKRSLALDPNQDETHHQISLVYSHIGLLPEADAAVQKALELNPNNTLARFRAGVYIAYRGRFDEAISIFKTIPRDFTPLLVDRSMAEALIQTGRLKEAEAITDEYLRDYPQDDGGSFTSVKAVLLAKAGKEKETEDAIRRAIEIGKGYGHFHHTAYNIASAYAALNRVEDAIKWLENAAENGFPNHPYFAIDPNLNNIRNDPSFIAFMARLEPQLQHFRSIAGA